MFLNFQIRKKSFLLNYFGASYDEKVSKKWKDIFSELEMYLKDGHVGGWSSFYCKLTWNDSTLVNDADLEIFDLLFEIDIKNGAEASKLVQSLCVNGAFEAVKVRNGLLDFHDFFVIKNKRSISFT